MTKPAIRWPGGKTRHLKHILPLITPHETYIEAFAGGLAVLLAKPRSAHEVVNDLNGALVSFYRCARFHCDELLRELDLAIAARAEFADYLSQPGLTEIQRSARWFVINILSWGAKGQHFGGAGLSFSADAKRAAIRALSARLDRVIIENLDYRELLNRFDRPSALFFIDPPYLAAPVGVYDGWTHDQMQELADILATLKGRWILTVDDSPTNRTIFARNTIRPISKPNGLNQSKPLYELLITRRTAK